MIVQKEITLKEARRGFHLITSIIEKESGELPETGIMNLFIKHTSAALAINENVDPTVRYDFENFMKKLIPEQDAYFTHKLEGPDDMPAHIKSTLFGQSINIPIARHRINLGTWQGIYYCEFREGGGNRTVVITILS